MVHWLLSHPNVFLNTSSDATLLPSILRAADRYEDSMEQKDIEKALQPDIQQLEMTPLFIRGVIETV